MSDSKFNYDYDAIKEKTSLDFLKTSGDVLSLLSGLEKVYLDKFSDLLVTKKERSEMTGLPIIERSDLGFFLDYIDFTRGKINLDFFVFYKARDTFLYYFKGKCNEYIQDLYDEGIIFQDSIYAKLNFIGIKKPVLKPNSRFYRFYKYWCNRDGWTLQEALSLFCCVIPKYDLLDSYSKEFTRDTFDLINVNNSFRDDKIHISYNIPFLFQIGYNNSPSYVWDMHLGNMVNLDKKLIISTYTKKIDVFEIPKKLSHTRNSIKLYDPKKITKWIYENTIIMPPEAMIECLFNEEEKEDFLKDYDKRKQNNKVALEQIYGDDNQNQSLFLRMQKRNVIHTVQNFFADYTQRNGMHPTQDIICRHLITLSEFKNERITSLKRYLGEVTPQNSLKKQYPIKEEEKIL